MKFPTDFASIIKNIYLHGLITVFVILDVFFYEHKKAKFDLINLVFIFIVFLLYAIFCSIHIAVGYASAISGSVVSGISCDMH